MNRAGCSAEFPQRTGGSHETDTHRLCLRISYPSPAGFTIEAARYFKPVRYEAYADVGSAENRRVWWPRVLAFFNRHLRADLEMRQPRGVPR